MGGSRWVTQVDDGLAATLRATAVDVATRVTDPERLRHAIEVFAVQTKFPMAARWRPHVVAQGEAGLALLCAQLDACFPGDGWDERGHAMLAAATRSLEADASPAVGLFDGLAGLAFTILALSRDGKRYARLLETVEDALVPRALALAEWVAESVGGIAVARYDAISGLAGVVAYLLARAGDERAAGALEAGLQALVALADPAADPPRWHSPPRLLDDLMRESFPGGNLNCGLAHGIPGSLAVLALSLRQGVRVDGLPEAVDRLAGWVASQAFEGPAGPTWPIAVPLDGGGPPRPSRTAWCYGAPGVARALWLGGVALDRADYRGLATSAMEAVYRTRVALRGIDSPTFCHGVAGLLQVTLRFANDTGSPVFWDAVSGLVAQLMAWFEPESLLGYRSLERSDSIVDQPGLLDGAPGVALVLLAASTSQVPAWDRLFVLA